jgi:hypothetical protein
MNTSLGAFPGMLYCNNAGGVSSPDATVKARAGMKWFRSNIRLESRLGLFALAIQFGLSFGHFHGSHVHPAFATVDPRQSVPYDVVQFAASDQSLLDRASRVSASGPVRLKRSSDQVPVGEPTGDCAICAVMALANAIVVAPPPCLLGPQAAAFSYLTTYTEHVALNTPPRPCQTRATPSTEHRMHRVSAGPRAVATGGRSGTSRAGHRSPGSLDGRSVRSGARGFRGGRDNTR